MLRLQHRRFTLPAKYPLLHQHRHGLIETIHIAHPTAQYNHIGIDQVYHLRQRFCQPQLIAAHRQFGDRILLRQQRGDLRTFAMYAAQPLIVDTKTGA